MRITQIVASIERRHGGPSQSVTALSQSLAEIGQDVTLLATAATPRVSMGDLSIHVFHCAWPQQITRSPRLNSFLRFHPAEYIHHHGLWLRTLHYAARAAKSQQISLIISPRGMMSPWAWNHHRSQKIFADRFIHPGALRGATGWHATSDSEADDIRALGFQQPICVSPNGVILPSGTDQEKATNHWHSICPATKERRVALFYGRFHRKKRVLELIELWATLPAAQWLLLIVGIPEEYTVADLQNYVINSKLQGRVVVFDGTDRPPPYAIASLFLLPSHSENFGLTVAESLVHGVPALVTDTTPWQEMSKQEAGWCVQWIDFSKTLKRVLTESQESLASRGSRGREWAEKTFSWTRSAKILVEFYTSLKAK